MVFVRQIGELLSDYLLHTPLHFYLFAAAGVECPHQALRNAEDKHRRDKVRLHAHVQEARDDADGVVGVDSREHQVAGQRCLHGKVGGLAVADLADHDDVRVLPQGGAQSVGKGGADLRPDLRLRYAGNSVLDRVLQREHVLAVAVHLVEQGVQRGRLSGAGGAGNQHQAVGLFNRRADESEVALGEAHAVDLPVFGLVAQNTHHHLFAVIGGEGRYAEVHLAAADARAKAAVLRLALFVQTHVGEHLDARDHRGVHLGRERDVGQKYAVDAEAHPRLVGHGLDVDVGGALLGGVPQHRRHYFGERREPGDRRRPGVGDGVALHRYGALFRILAALDGYFGLQLVECLADLAGEPLVLTKQPLKVGFGDKKELVGHPYLGRDKGKRIARLEIVRVGDTDLQNAVGLAERHQRVVPRRLLRHEPQNVEGYRLLPHLARGDAVVVALGLEDIRKRDAGPLQHRLGCGSVFFKLGLELGYAFLGDNPCVSEYGKKIHTMPGPVRALKEWW